MKTNLLNAISKIRYLALLMFLTLLSTNVWGETITITQTALGLSGSYTSTSKAVSGVTFKWTDLMKNSTNIQAKASTGAIWNTTAIPGKITSIAVTHSGTARSSTIYFGTSAKAETNSTTFSGTKTINAPSGSFSYFYIKRGSNAAYWTQIVITYEAAASCTTSPTVGAGSISSVTTTGATVSCTAGITSLGSAGCTISSYGFVYGTATSPTLTTGTQVQKGTAYTTTGTAFSHSLTGLTPGTTYYVRPYATNGNGTSYGTQTSFTTLNAPTLTLNKSSIAYGDKANGGGPYTATFTVAGAHLTSNISISVGGTNSALFSVDKTSISYGSGTVAATTVTVSYTPTSVGSHSATITVSSTGATSKTISLSGTSKYTYTWMKNGAVHATTLVASGTKPTFPTDPTSCDDVSTTFIGWTNAEWTGTLDDVSAKTIHESNSTMSNASANQTFYAVFAKAGAGGTTTESVTWSDVFSVNQTSVEGEELTIETNATVTYNKGTNNNECKYFTTGSAIRVYSGGNFVVSAPSAITSITVSFGSGDGSNTITADVGTYSNGNWTGSSNSVTFSVGGTSGHRRIAGISVTYGAGATYSKYLTNCCTALGTVSATLSAVSGTTANFTWSAVTGAEKYQVKVVGSSSHNTWTDATSGVTVSGLTAGTAYTAYFRAIDTNGSHCSESEETSKAFTTPKLTVTPTTITGLNYPVGSGPSDAQSFTVSGVGLTGAVTITAPTNFEVSKTSATSGFGSSVTLTPSSGTISTTTIWVRLASGKAQGTYGASNVTVAGGSATTVNVSVTGVVSSACEDPTINTHPAGATYNLNATATALSVAATKNGTGPALAYQWYSNTANNNTTGSAIPSATSNMYTPPTTATDTKYYYCVVSSGACETATNTATITVRTPSITVSKTSIAYGDKARGEGHTETFTVSGTNLASGQGLSLAISGTNNTMFSVDKTSVAQTSAGTVATTTITVTYTPSSNGAHSATITVSSTGAENKTVTLSGTGKWKVTWMKGGAEYTAGTPTTLVANSNKVTTLPTAPADNALGSCANKFMGWSRTNIGNTPVVSAPADLFTTAANSPAITANTTFYAVYATASGGTGTATFNPSTQAGLSNSDRTWTHTASGITLQLVGNASYTKRTDTHWQLGYTNGQATAHYAVITSPTTITRIDITLDESQYKVNSVTNGTLNTSGTSQTITGSFTTTTLYPYVAQSGSKQAHMTNIVVTYSNATYSDYVTECCTDWSAPTLTYSIPSGWKAGDADVSATIGSGTTHGAVSFESSNTGVLTVNASTGKIHAVGAGTATVTATWAGDVTYCEKSRTSTTITVSGNVTVNFDKNGGSGTMTSQSIPYNTATALKANTFTAPTCKEFYGWADSQAKADAGTRDYTDGQSVTLTTGKTLYAVWKDKTYTVTKGSNTGAGTFTLSTSTITCGATLTITCAADGDHKGNPTVTATGTHGAITVVSATSVTIANVQSDMTVNISYPAKDIYTITWSANGAELTGGALGSAPTSVTEGNAIGTLPPNPTSCSD